MDVSSLLLDNPTENPTSSTSNSAVGRRNHPYETRHTMSAVTRGDGDDRRTPPAAYGGQSGMTTPHNPSMSPFGSPTPKSVSFELLFPESPQIRARLPMRVQIFPHDTTDSIITTVKNFYGLYPGQGGTNGVSFEDEQGNTLIARYENFRNNMIVYVRVINDTAAVFGPPAYQGGAPNGQPGYYNGDGHLPAHHPAQALSYGQPPSRPGSRASRKRSVSPNTARGRRSASASTIPMAVKKNRSRSGFKSRGSSTHGGYPDLHSDGLTGYSSGDGAPGSVSSKTKSEQLGNTEISLDNIVEGGRRKRAKFESSELPLFAPPQMPAAASNSSVSPARRIEHGHRASFSFGQPSHNPFSNGVPLPSPQSYNNGFGQPGLYSTPAPGRRTRNGTAYPQSRHSIGVTPNNSSGILPTPDPTVGSCMSEEDKDVALQLMRLGDMSNISHGRTSASTLDDTFSGRADAASSTGATSDSEESDEELPPARLQKREYSPILPPGAVKKSSNALPSQDSADFTVDEAEYEDGHDGTFRPETREGMTADSDVSKAKKSQSKASSNPKPRINPPGAKSNKASKAIKSNRSSSSSAKGKTKAAATTANVPKAPMSPASIPTQSRKASVSSALNFQHQLADDEEDLSTKPRCQRCRKSKKGCDRQRPCQRCKDAGLSADQCVSEDEGNGRKGRYGRHMGVPIKKDDAQVAGNGAGAGLAAAGVTTAAGGVGSPDKGKKRKR